MHHEHRPSWVQIFTLYPKQTGYLDCHSLNFLICKTGKIILSSSTCVGRMDEEMQPQAYVRSAQQILISLWRCFPLLQKSVELLLFSNSYWIQFQYLIERTSLDRIKNVVFKWEVCYDNYHKICPHLNKAYSQSTWEEDECIFRWSSWSSQYCITIVMTYNLLSSCYVPGNVLGTLLDYNYYFLLFPVVL